MIVLVDNYAAWAARHPLAAAELAALLVPPVLPAAAGTPGSEAYITSAVRLEAASKGVRLWRNQVGAATTDTGVFLRFGLANDSAQINARLKSSDLIGWRRVTITPAMVGSVIAQFVSREIKPAAWRLTPGDKRAAAQSAWLALCAADGADSCFASGVGTL